MKPVYLGACALLLALWFAPPASWAQEGLYSAEVPVAGEGAEERNRAMAEAMQAVLVKLTGSRGVATRGGFDALTAAAPALVQQYRYRLDPGDGDRPPSRYLWVRFDAAALDRRLAEQGWRIWRPPRPRVLVWLTAEQLGQRRFLQPDAAPDISTVLRREAQARGIPLQWPLLDLEDQSRLTPADLWGGFEEGIRAASGRYGEGPILVGRFRSQPGGTWRPEWLLYDSTGVQSFSGGAAALTEALTEGVNLASDLLAGRYGPPTTVSSGKPVRVEVQGIQTIEDYALAFALVGGASGVNRISLRSAADDVLTFEVWVDGDAPYLAQALGADPRLQAVPAVAAADTGADRLSYLWVP